MATDEQRPAEDPVPKALDELATANTPAQLIAKHRAVARAVQASRRGSKRVYGTLATAFGEVMKFWDEWRAASTRTVDPTPMPSEEDRIDGLQRVLRENWPKGREWHYVCAFCHDTGLVPSTCHKGARCNGISMRTDGPGQEPGKYKRLCFHNPASDYEHEYSTPCFCVAGSKWKPQPRPTPDDFTRAAKSKKSSDGFTRFGR